MNSLGLENPYDITRNWKLSGCHGRCSSQNKFYFFYHTLLSWNICTLTYSIVFPYRERQYEPNNCPVGKDILKRLEFFLLNPILVT